MVCFFFIVGTLLRLWSTQLACLCTSQTIPSDWYRYLICMRGKKSFKNRSKNSSCDLLNITNQHLFICMCVDRWALRGYHRLSGAHLKRPQGFERKFFFFKLFILYQWCTLSHTFQIVTRIDSSKFSIQPIADTPAIQGQIYILTILPIYLINLWPVKWQKILCMLWTNIA